MAVFNVTPSEATFNVQVGENTAQAAASAARAEAWAVGTEPGGIGTKSAREWAESVTLTTATDGSAFASRTLLAAVAAPVAGQTAVVSEAGASGIFRFSNADLSAEVAIDSTRGIYVAPTAAPTGASGAWVRQTAGRWKTSWFLTTPGAFTTSAIIQKIEDLRPAGQDVKFNVSGTYNVGGIFVRKPGWWSGTGKNTVMNHTGGETINTFGVCTSGGTRFSHMSFTGFRTTQNVSRFPIYVSPEEADIDVPADMEDFEFDHLWFYECDTGIRVTYGNHTTEPGLWRTPFRTHIHDCVFENILLQAVIPESNDVHIERCTFSLNEKPVGGYRPRSHSIRALGCDRVTVSKCRFNVPADYPAIGVMLAGINAGTPHAYRNARNVTIDGNWFYGGHVLMTESADVLRVTNNFFWNDPQRTDGKPPPVLKIDGSQVPVYAGQIVFEDNVAWGFPDTFSLVNQASNVISIKRNTVYGNLRAMSAFEAIPVNIQINNGFLVQDGSAQLPAPVLVEIEDNNFFANPSGCGAVVLMTANLTGMHLRYSGNKVPERTVNYNHVNHNLPAGTTPKVSLSRTSEFTDWSSNSVPLQAAVVGDNTCMPSGFYASVMASSKFRPEQVIGTFPPVFP